MKITIGKPIANTQIYIVDKYMNCLPIGVTGEICVAGDGVGAGYLNRPELTAEKFIDNPFGEGKLYKTGDLAYWREDGNLVYVGRNDFQVKIRGLRIELGEIENAISSVDGIAQSVVVVRKDKEGRQLICAFYTGQEIEAKVIRAEIGKRLPKYMLPHIFTHLDEMPLTPSGKRNRKALPEVDLENIQSDMEYVAPQTDTEKLLCAIMAEILNAGQVGLTDDFFDLGGDSLKAIELISACESEGLHIDLQSVFEHPTPKEMIENISANSAHITLYDKSDFAELHKLIENNKPAYTPEAKEVAVGNILLAGATGYLGAHILDEYLKNDSGTAYCIVRGESVDDSKQRLIELLRFYFGDVYSAEDRIVVLCGDVTEKQLGLSENDYRLLLSHVNTVINSVASVKHYGSYGFFHKANVQSVEHLIAFCKEAAAKLIHISTTSVAGNDFDTEMSFVDMPEEIKFTEHDLYIGQPLDNVYVRSKFEAECTVLTAMQNGLQANIMRMGNLTNRRRDGVFQRNYESNAFLKHIKAITDLGLIPSDLLNLKTEFTPIDEAAKAVMAITRHFRNDCNVFHIENTNPISFDSLFSYMHMLGLNLQSVSKEQFNRALRKSENDPKTKHILETFINEIGEDGNLHYESSIEIDTSFTKQYLHKLGFDWLETDLDYLSKYFSYFREIGYIRSLE